MSLQSTHANVALLRWISSRLYNSTRIIRKTKHGKTRWFGNADGRSKNNQQTKRHLGATPNPAGLQPAEQGTHLHSTLHTSAKNNGCSKEQRLFGKWQIRHTKPFSDPAHSTHSHFYAESRSGSATQLISFEKRNTERLVGLGTLTAEAKTTST